MPKIVFISPDGSSKEVNVAPGTTVMAAALHNGIAEILAECGGLCMCATCHVFVDPAFFPKLPPIQDDENSMLEITAEERQPTSRLSCQLKMTDALDGLTVRLPSKQR